MSVALQQIPYLGPKLEVTIGDATSGIKLTQSVRAFHVWSSRSIPADVCELVVADVLAHDIKEDDPLTIRWGYKGFDLDTIFDGFVSETRPMKRPLPIKGRRGGRRLAIRGVDRMKRLYDTRVTKTFQDERPATIIRNLLAPLGIDTSGVAEVDVVLDRLPLYNDHIVHAIRTINRRLNLDHDFWFGADGTFHWATLEIPKVPSWRFSVGKNIIEYEETATAARLLTIGVSVRHGELVEVEDGAVRQHLCESTHHYQDDGKGFRTELSLKPTPEAA